MKKLLFIPLLAMGLSSCEVDTSLDLGKLTEEEKEKREEIETLMAKDNTYQWSVLHLDGKDTLKYSSSLITLKLDIATEKAVVVESGSKDKVFDKLHQDYVNKWTKIKQIEGVGSQPDLALMKNVDSLANKNAQAYIGTDKTSKKEFAYDLNNSKLITFTGDGKQTWQYAIEKEGSKITLSWDSIRKVGDESDFFLYDSVGKKYATSVKSNLSLVQVASEAIVDTLGDGNYILESSIIYYGEDKKEMSNDQEIGIAKITKGRLESESLEISLKIVHVKGYNILVFVSDDSLHPITYLPFKMSVDGSESLILEVEIENDGSNLKIFEFEEDYAKKFRMTLKLTKI